MADFNDRVIYDGIDVTLPKNSSITVANNASLNLVGNVNLNGQPVLSMVQMTQAEYNATSHSPNILYVIIG